MKIIKKFRRFLRFKKIIYILKIVNFILVKYKFYLIPDLSSNALSKLKYSSVSNSFYFSKSSQKINTIRIETSNFTSDLCKIGSAFGTDKSPYSKHKAPYGLEHRHPYTGVYDLLFQDFRNQKFNFAEIGILENNSIKMFRNYFSNAKIYGFEYDKKLIKKAKSHRLRNTFYSEIDVTNERSIKHNLSKFKKKFKVIIDDSTHVFDDQIRLINNCIDFLDPGGMLIIEDIFHIKNIETKYINSIKKYLKSFEKIFFIECNHINKHSKGFDNDKLMILKKK